jgi:protein-S-isoprenylcysteine O-methyltransferase Ste14
MPAELLTFNRGAVFCGAVVYWGGVFVQARRVRKRIGKSPNVRPKGLKEKLLWAGWSFVVLAWVALPLISGSMHQGWWQIASGLIHPLGTIAAMIMLAAGYAGTLWCYVAMGNAWRMGIDRKAKTDLITTGPYRFVRHPIYLFQLLMVAAIPVLLPSFPALLVLIVHLVCVVIKATDEETFLRSVLGEPYQLYCGSSGRWLPKFGCHKSSVASSTAATPSSHLKPANSNSTDLSHRVRT